LPPLPHVVPPEYDLLYHQMRSAFEGDPEVWRRVTMSLRDAIVDHAVRHSPYYRRTIRPGSPFEAIPILTRSVIREHLVELVADDVPDERKVLERTSGSSEDPLDFLRDTAKTMADSMASDRFFRSLHGVPLDATIIAVVSTSHGPERFSRWTRSVGRLRRLAGGPPARDPWLLTLPMVDVRPENVQRHLDRWSRLRRYFFVGQSSGIDWIAGQIEEGNALLRRPPVGIAATSDSLTEQARLRMERVFGLPVHSRYGSKELQFLACCLPGDTDRFLFNPLLAYVELLDDEGQPVGLGEVGRIILTDLNDRVMPLIRYEQGDLAVASPDGYVGGFPVIEGLVGRESEVLRFPSGRILGASALGKLLFKRNDFTPWVRGFQCVQTGPNEVELRVEWAREPGELTARIAEVIRAAADPGTVVRVRAIEELERTASGKVWVVRGLGAGHAPSEERVLPRSGRT
jgi:phenylacetate-CoA ligase